MAVTAAQVTVDGTAGGVALNTASVSGQKLVIPLASPGREPGFFHARMQKRFCIKNADANSVVCHVLRTGV
jgi:hypothetical protein